jgi:hypothetical protein
MGIVIQQLSGVIFGSNFGGSASDQDGQIKD